MKVAGKLLDRDVITDRAPCEHWWPAVDPLGPCLWPSRRRPGLVVIGRDLSGEEASSREGWLPLLRTGPLESVEVPRGVLPPLSREAQEGALRLALASLCHGGSLRLEVEASPELRLGHLIRMLEETGARRWAFSRGSPEILHVVA